MELFIKISGFFLSLASSTGGLRERERREEDKEDDNIERGDLAHLWTRKPAKSLTTASCRII